MAHSTTAGGGASRYALAPLAGPAVIEDEIRRRGGVPDAGWVMGVAQNERVGGGGESTTARAIYTYVPTALKKPYVAFAGSSLRGRATLENNSSAEGEGR